MGTNRATKEKEEQIENDFMHYENRVYPCTPETYPSLKEAFAAGWRARDNREGPFEVREGFSV